MTSNQRRSGFRLPWISDEEQGGEPVAPAEPESAASGQPAHESTAASSNGASATGASATTASEQPSIVDADAPSPTASPERGAAPVAPGSAPAAGPSVAGTMPAAAEPPSDFLRDLVGAMRGVAEEARTSGVTKLSAEAEEAVRALEADAERRRAELRERAEADVAGVGEWARAETERIRVEAEQRVAARRAQLEEQLAAERIRTEAEARAFRKRVEDYERELEAFHAQLSEITDPAAFAAAAKRMPRPPELAPRAPSTEAQPVIPGVAPSAPSANGTSASPADRTAVGAPTAAPVAAVHPAEEVLLSGDLPQLEAMDAARAPATDPANADAATTDAGTTGTTLAEAGATADGATTEIVVKGLGSFGAITGFRQSLSSQPGIATVALSLGQTGEFVFRATHAPGFDVAGAITSMEGDNATVEPRPEGGLRVTLERPR